MSFSRTPLGITINASLLALGFAACQVLAHDPGHAELNGWMQSLHSEAGSPCCSGYDATVLTDRDWTVKDGHYQINLNGQWIDVPPNAVVDGPNRDGRTLVWPYYLNGELIGIRCFMPGTMT